MFFICMLIIGTVVLCLVIIFSSSSIFSVPRRRLYRQPFLYRHSIQRQNLLQWQFECHETFTQEVTVNEKLCKNIALKLKATCFGYLLESPRWGDSNKYPKHMFSEEIKKRSFLHIILSIKASLQQQIHYNGNVFGNKCCRCNEGFHFR